MKPVGAALALVALAFAARADEVVTIGGSSYAGKIVAEDDASVTIDTPALGRLRVARAEIAKVQRDDAPPAAKPDAPKDEAKAQESKAPTAKNANADDKAPSTAKKNADQPAPVVKPAEGDDPAVLSAEERDDRRKASKILRRTAPAATKQVELAKAADAPDSDEKASLGGTLLAKVEPGAWVVVFQPPTQFEAAPAAIQVGRRLFARLDSAGVASAWLSVPQTGGERRVPIRLVDVQRHVVVKPGASRLRLIEGVDRGTWLRMRLDDGTVVQGTLRGAQSGVISLSRPKTEGPDDKVDVGEEKIVEVDGLLRSTAMRLSLAEVALGEPVGLTLWPDGEIVGKLIERTEHVVKIQTCEGDVVPVPVEGPIADVRRVPTKWRAAIAGLDTLSLVRAKTAEEFADSRVERDVVGAVLALTTYAVTLDTSDGAVVLPFDLVTAFDRVESESEASAARSMQKSERECRLPVLPGDPAEKAKGLDPASGVSAVTDGDVVKHVVVTAPFDGEVFGIQLGNRAADARDRTDLRFDTVVTPRGAPGADSHPAEMISTSLHDMRVTVVLDSVGAVSAIELGVR